MNSRNNLLISALRRGTVSAGQLAELTQTSQPTVSRALASLPPSRLHRIGKGRSTRYAWKREIDGATHWPLYRLDEAGDAHRLATIYALEGGQWHVEMEESWPSLEHPMFANGLYPDWPWFLDDLMPRGFLGRLFANACAERRIAPPDPRDWSATHTLRALVQLGHDVPGGFVIGGDNLARAGSSAEATDGPALEPDLLLRKADEVLQGRWPGSSAAGEQPKFTLTLGSRAGPRRFALVKFSGKTTLPDQARRADLLRAEHLANRILLDHGIPAARTDLRVVKDRVFLIAERFDRTASGGRRLMVSLHALNAAFGDVNRSWVESASNLRGQGWLDASGIERLGVCQAFGSLIGNTDMHDGNASFFLSPWRPFVPTPVYDMCPMGLAPRADGSLPDKPPSQTPPPPEHQPHFERARPMAEAYAAAIVADPSFSPAFRAAFAHMPGSD